MTKSKNILAGNKYVTSGSNNKSISITILVSCLFLLTTLNRYQTIGSNGNFLFYYCLEEYVCCDIWTISGNHTTFGFSHDSLNSMNSAKPFREKLQCDGFMPTCCDLVPLEKDVALRCGREMWLPLDIQSVCRSVGKVNLITQESYLTM